MSGWKIRKDVRGVGKNSCYQKIIPAGSLWLFHRQICKQMQWPTKHSLWVPASHRKKPWGLLNAFTQCISKGWLTPIFSSNPIIKSGNPKWAPSPQYGNQWSKLSDASLHSFRMCQVCRGTDWIAKGAGILGVLGPFSIFHLKTELCLKSHIYFIFLPSLSLSHCFGSRPLFFF